MHASLPYLWSGKLIGAMAITFIVQGVTIGAYAARLAGVQTKRIATSISLFNLFVTTGRLANLFMGFFVGPLSDEAGNAVGHLQGQPAAAAAWQKLFELQLRLIVLAGTLGMVAFALFLPMFTYLFRRGVHSFEARGSVPHSLTRLLAPSVIARRAAVGASALASRSCASFDWRALAEEAADLQHRRDVRLRHRACSRRTSPRCSTPTWRARRSALSGIINGIGTIAFTLFVDPTSSMITDQAIHGKRTVQEVRSMVFYLSLTAIIGSLLSQAMLYPAAVIIEVVARFAAHVRLLRGP